MVACSVAASAVPLLCPGPGSSPCSATLPAAPSPSAATDGGCAGAGGRVGDGLAAAVASAAAIEASAMAAGPRLSRLPPLLGPAPAGAGGASGAVPAAALPLAPAAWVAGPAPPGSGAFSSGSILAQPRGCVRHPCRGQTWRRGRQGRPWQGVVERLEGPLPRAMTPHPCLGRSARWRRAWHLRMRAQVSTTLAGGHSGRKALQVAANEAVDVHGRPHPLV
jgi:hypothetical protein